MARKKEKTEVMEISGGAEEKIMRRFEERAIKMKDETLHKHMDELSKLLSEMLDGYKRNLMEMVKNLGSIKEEGLSGLLSKSSDIQVGVTENPADTKTTLDISIGEKTHTFTLTPRTKYKMFVVAIPAGEAEVPAPEVAPAEEAPPAPEEAPAEEAPPPA